MHEKLVYIREKCLEANPEIGSRPIRLADVLHALQEQYDDFIPDTMVSALCQVHWNLCDDDLSHQEVGAVDYIYKILQETN